MSRTAAAKKESIKVKAVTPAVHHMARGLGAEEGHGLYTGDQLDAICNKWVNDGYRLEFVHPTYVKQEQGPGGTAVTQAQWHILYNFVRDEQSVTIKDGAIHHMVRGLSAAEGVNLFSGDQLDEHCQTWLDQGYKLKFWFPQYVVQEQGPGGINVNSAQWHILYIFVKD